MRAVAMPASLAPNSVSHMSPTVGNPWARMEIKSSHAGNNMIFLSEKPLKVIICTFLNVENQVHVQLNERSGQG